MEALIERAVASLRSVFRDSMPSGPSQENLVIFDTKAPLTQILTEGYRRVLPGATFVDFETLTPPEVLARINALKSGDGVFLVQSTNFRLDEFRLRIELFRRGLKTIEHLHLARMSPDQFETYLDALAYDPAYYRPLGRGLKEILDQSRETVVECDGTRLVYQSPMEPSKLNIGDYTGMQNIGGTYPIGEVFTEPQNLQAVNGEVRIFGCAGDDHCIRLYDPFVVTVQDGILSAPSGPPEFQVLLEKIRQDDAQVLIREFGLGLNPAMSKTKIVNDITAFERQKGLHLSLGAKHAIYAKPGLSRKHGRYHVDVFVDAKRILVDGEAIFENGRYVLENC